MENFCLTKKKRWRVPVCSLAGRLVVIVLSAGLTLFGGLMIRSGIEPGTFTGAALLVGGIGACLMLFIACYRYENLIQWHWIIGFKSPTFLIAVMVMGTTVVTAVVSGFNLQPSECQQVIITAALCQSQTASLIPSLSIVSCTALGFSILQPD